ncbi:glycosyltransferase [Candidatus Parcubacteria bacterium]|nr:glycosyltransferase [Candidatus Parcubacteria bacterium]
MKPSISICNIVKNEEKQISDFLAHLVAFADEIIIVDTGSSDRTIEIVDEYRQKYKNIKFLKYDSEGVFHYGKAKNFSMKQATKDYIIILDTDERLSENFKSKIFDFLQKEKLEVAKAKRVDECLKHLIDYPDKIIKRSSGIFYETDEKGMVHEGLNYTNKRFVFDEIIWHQQRENHYIYRPQRILFQLELQIERTTKTKSLFGHFLRGVWYAQFRFKNLYFKRKLYKDGKIGFKYAFMRALDAFLIELFVGLKPKGDYKCWNTKD